MFKKPPSDINIIQNIQIMLPQSKQCHKKKRITSSVIFLDEEPIFSDSEEELEYTRKIFGKTIRTEPLPVVPVPVVNKYRQVGVQCEILKQSNKSLTNLIHQCSNINPDNVDQNFREIIESCNRFTERLSFELVRSDSSSDISNSSKFLDDVESVLNVDSIKKQLPSRYKNVGDHVQQAKNNLTTDKKIRQLKRKQVFTTDGPKMRAKRRKRVTKKRKKKLPQKNLRSKIANKNNDMIQPIKTIPGAKELGRKEKPMSTCKKTVDSKKAGRKQKSQDSSKNNKFTSTPLVNKDAVLGKRMSSSSSGNVSDLDSLFNTASESTRKLSAKFIKPLARNWMKPNKSLCLEENVKIQPHYASLQLNRNVRRLYSPTQFLHSQDFFNTCTQYD